MKNLQLTDEGGIITVYKRKCNTAIVKVVRMIGITVAVSTGFPKDLRVLISLHIVSLLILDLQIYDVVYSKLF